MDQSALVEAMAPTTIEFEGSIAWMYKDTRNVITCGVGQALETTEDALVMPWYTPDKGPNGSHSSNRGEILSEYARVGAMASGLHPDLYKRPNSPLLTEVDIMHQLKQTLAGVAAELTVTFKEFNQFPLQAQLAILDMAYNLGIHGLQEKFPKLCNSIRAWDWMVAANQCARLGVQPYRNTWAWSQFKKANGFQRPSGR